MSENSAMSSDSVLLREASRLLRLLASPIEAGESVKACRRRVHRRLKSWSANRVRDVWRPDPRIRIRPHEIEQLREIAAQQRSDRAARSELRALQMRIERLEALLTATDPEMHSPSIDAYRAQRREVVRALGTGDRSEPKDTR